VNVRPYGERAVLVEVDDAHLVPAVRAALGAERGVLDAVGGAETVLVVFDPAVTSADRVVDALDRGEFRRLSRQNSPNSVDVPVVYDGADLDEVAAEVGMTPAEVAHAHARGAYTVRFCGFSPGFAYLDGLDPRLHVPRRASPRTAVPAGSVAVAGEFTGVYPQPSPGGWRLLGRTGAPLWDVTRDPPALLAPGTRVRFVPA
jgi:KipI family sensor histidine kinase inhibitor